MVSVSASRDQWQHYLHTMYFLCSLLDRLLVIFCFCYYKKYDDTYSWIINVIVRFLGIIGWYADVWGVKNYFCCLSLLVLVFISLYFSNPFPNLCIIIHDYDWQKRSLTYLGHSPGSSFIYINIVLYLTHLSEI